MRNLINKIPNKNLRIFLKEYIFHRRVNEELLDQIESDIINILQEKSMSSFTRSSYMVMGETPEDRLAVKQAIREKLLRKIQPPVFLISFVYPFLVALITAVIVSKCLN